MNSEQVKEVLAAICIRKSDSWEIREKFVLEVQSSKVGQL